MNDYTSHRKLPSLAGICTFDRAVSPGLSVDQCVSRLKRSHYTLKRLHGIFISRLTAEPIYELKMAFSLHGHLCAEHVTALRRRVSEMREPPLGLEQVPDGNLEIFFDELLAAPSTEELLLGIYEKALPALKGAFERHLGDTNPLADHPSVRLCRFALLEIDQMLQYGKEAVPCLVDAACREKASGWLQLLDECLRRAGSLDGTTEIEADLAPRNHSAQPYQYDSRPGRDERFSDPYNMGVNAEVFLYDEKIPPAPKTLMMFYKRFREIDVPEMMASILVETRDKPWDYYRDLTRQLWDEARHAMMGEAGFVQQGIDWRKVMINFTWSLALNTQLKPLERHAVLYFIEQGLMSKTGKRYEWEVGQASGNPLAALFQDYDWADEVLHARIGRDWYLKEFKDAREAVQYGDACWSRVLMDWGRWRDLGLTRHRNWWPDVYQEACRRWGIDPDPRVLNYSTSYETVRADLKDLSVSG
jgi:hypothetical protein